jgi:heme/copper-type cytochrome/quinol oxidase subunit 1
LGFAALLLPWTPAPLFALAGPQNIEGREVFTALMRWAIFPVVAFFLIACVRALVIGVREGRIGRRDLSDPRLAGFLASAVLTLIGWGLGASIRGSTTMIPAHYHAAIGAVTVAFMAQSYPLLAAVGVPVTGARSRRLMGLQPALFGIGQSIFALGFAFAGAHGMGRKLYGREQEAKSFEHLLGLGVMGVGGLLAVVAGVLFLVIVARAWRRREHDKSAGWVLDAPEPGGTHG